MAGEPMPVLEVPSGTEGLVRKGWAEEQWELTDSLCWSFLHIRKEWKRVKVRVAAGPALGHSVTA